MSEREYPKLPAIAEAVFGKVESAVLRDMLNKTAFSVSQDDTRQHLAGVFFECDGKSGRMVSTDGHRLSKVGREMTGAPEFKEGVLIPRKGVAEIRRVLEAREASSELSVHQGHFILRADDVTLIIKLSDGQFPPHEQVIPKDNDRVVELGREELLDAFRRIAIMASDKTWGVRVGIDKGRLTIEADNPDQGNAHEMIEVAYKGTPVQIGFNARYFIDLLTEMTSPTVRLELAAELDPAVVRPADGSDYLGVIMPMRL
jgi:DNA polymerase-3 subunit beta